MINSHRGRKENKIIEDLEFFFFFQFVNHLNSEDYDCCRKIHHHYAPQNLKQKKKSDYWKQAPRYCPLGGRDWSQTQDLEVLFPEEGLILPLELAQVVREKEAFFVGGRP
ncbi:hypothetical protein L6164_015357 [Bauhinia variegata]|uniref:Uncharacterized protein n=1 Tax=Bauhinia variegata TaxID=167791 RepID=A0ACB9NKC5_BAUVA|nr:hypothetical protein L6164_015357 [Bauhinia variegata]